MTNLREAAQMALEALEEAQSYTSCETWSPSMTNECAAAAEALRAALAQPKPETVGYLTNVLGDERIFTTKKINQYSQPLYTAPPQREFIGLTDEEEIDCYRDAINHRDFYRAIEAKLREKNA